MTSDFNVITRSCGILLHPTSLPGPHGCGDMGRSAHDFVDFLAAAGQSWWQMLPVNPPGPGNAPYSARSAFAGSPRLISLDTLARQGLIKTSNLKPPGPFPSDRVSYPRMMAWRLSKLRDAFANHQTSVHGYRAQLNDFIDARSHWLPDYTLFAALHRAHKGRAWYTWPIGERTRRNAILRETRRTLANQIEFEVFLQYQFDRQWMDLIEYSHAKGVGLIGDVPIFTAHDSSDVWANPKLFELESSGLPRLKSGVPPDLFSKNGQLWGHPLYRWPQHRASNYTWWVERFKAAMRWFDVVRIDHFLGFRRLWAVGGKAKTARIGHWVHTPGEALLQHIIKTVGPNKIIAEDLGLLTPEAAALLNDFQLPGMRVLHWAFGDDQGARYHQPHNHPRNCVVYTGTHDNDTALGWWNELPKHARRRSAAQRKELRKVDHADDAPIRSPWKQLKDDRARFWAYVGMEQGEVNWGMIRAAYQSPANLAIVPLQDVLGLDGSGRMNDPCTSRGNWEWRMQPGAIQSSHARRLKLLADTYARLPIQR